MPLRIACVVEGHGDVNAVPTVIRRVAQEVEPATSVVIPHPIRIPKGKLLRPGELERAVQLAAMQAGERGGILILIDADDDCPAQLAPALLARARTARGDVPLAVVLPKSEFESWFLAAAESLRGHHGLPADLQPPANPEAIRGAKEWIHRYMQGGYVPTLHQASLAAAFDIQLARRADSFDKCYREIARLLAIFREAGEVD